MAFHDTLQKSSGGVAAYRNGDYTNTTREGAAVRFNNMGIEKRLITPGHGPKPTAGQTVTVHCTGYGKDGDLSQKFWSTRDLTEKPFTFKIGLGRVIKGWDEGVLGMQLGERARLLCSPDYAYGEGGFSAWGIQPNSVLEFDIEVLTIE
ncbi:Peptidyl-prolyl cis-trans isomerase FKBP12 [Euphorbia peplus]|nr:Peptidyl-prolyl cis-trans isomerase FKBP12 [Euphorbia peplus]